jgi:hypothetical protein
MHKATTLRVLFDEWNRQNTITQIVRNWHRQIGRQRYWGRKRATRKARQQ